MQEYISLLSVIVELIANLLLLVAAIGGLVLLVNENKK